MNNINEEVGERLEIFIKHLDITVEEFCRITHLKRGTVDKARKGKHGPRVETLDGITKGYPQLNLRWLITGEGEMLQRQLSKEETTLLDHYWAHTDRTNFMVRVQFYWDEYAEKEYM